MSESSKNGIIPGLRKVRVYIIVARPVAKKKQTMDTMFEAAHLHIRQFVTLKGAIEGGGALSDDQRPSVCLSDVAYISSNSKTKRPRKTKLRTWVPQVTCDSHTDFKVKRSKGQKSRSGRGHIVAAT